MHLLDEYSIKNQNITSYQLMERASNSLANRIMQRIADTSQNIVIFCGGGNNGGDGLAIGRILHTHGYNVECLLLKSKKYSHDCSANFDLAKSMGIARTIESVGDIPNLGDCQVIIDAIFGSGLSRNIEGFAADVVDIINFNSNNRLIIAVDIPSGLTHDGLASQINGAIVHADWTLTIESPFLSLLLAENYDVTGDFDVVPINLDSKYLASSSSVYSFTTMDDIRRIWRPRGKFSHKGTFGHALLMAGSDGKAGAAVMCARACHRAGAGLVTVFAKKQIVDILQVATPETMVEVDRESTPLLQVLDCAKYSAIGIGPGIGKSEETAERLVELLKFNYLNSKKPLVLDADALNLLSFYPEWYQYLLPGTILTPHPKEFERLFGKTANSIERLKLLAEMAKEHNIIIVLKGANTAVADCDGNVYFNSTGNPGMATAGSGDVLTGVVAALLSQKYSPLDAAMLGVFAHGLAGDIVSHKIGSQGMIASDIIDALPLAFHEIAEY